MSKAYNMDQEFALTGYPSFVRRIPETDGVNWWAPVRSGDPMSDFEAGKAHFTAALELLNSFRSPGNYYSGLVTPLNPHSVLAGIVCAMQQVGPMEGGFLSALVDKALVGRAPPIDQAASDHQAQGEEYAHACLAIARDSKWPDLVTDEMVNVVERTFDVGCPAHFAWIVCTAAASGALS